MLKIINTGSKEAVYLVQILVCTIVVALFCIYTTNLLTLFPLTYIICLCL